MCVLIRVARALVYHALAAARIVQAAGAVVVILPRAFIALAILSGHVAWLNLAINYLVTGGKCPHGHRAFS